MTLTAASSSNDRHHVSHPPGRRVPHALAPLCSCQGGDDVFPYAVEDLGGRSLVVGRDADGRAVGGEHDPELAVDAVHAPGAVAGAASHVQAVGPVVGFGAAGVGGVRDHSGDVGGRNQALAVVGALVQEQLRDAGDFRGSQLKADRPEREAERATEPLRVADAEGGE